MSTDNHYFVEKNEDEKFAIRAKGSDRASGLFETQAIPQVKELNPADHPDVSRVRETLTGGPDKWRKA
jgi:hypothetical protein